MKIYILADMEGISGIRRAEQVMMNDSPAYTEGRELMMAEINVAIEAAFAAGADEVIACDTHGMGGQVALGQMDERAVYETPNAGRMMPALDESFGGVVLLGHHGMAGTLNGFLDHTMDSRNWFEYRINDQPVGEIGIEAAWAAHYGVPVIAVAGDQCACDEAREIFGEVETAVVKWGVGRQRARCLSLAAAHGRVREAVTKAVRQAGQYTPFRPELPATVQLTVCRADMADHLALRPGVERVDARTLRQSVDSLLDICRW